MIDYKLIGSRLKRQRECLGLAQENLSEIVGITTVYLSKIENGKVHPTLEILSSLCNALHCDLGKIFLDTEIESDKYQNEAVVDMFQKCAPHVKQTALRILEELSKIR